MKEQINRCPGCSRHCRLDHVRCKYGQKYLEKMEKAQAEKTGCDKDRDAKKRLYKWEKYVLRGGRGWKLLWTARCCKRALREGKLTEQELFSALDEEEQAQLGAILDKLLRRVQ